MGSRTRRTGAAERELADVCAALADPTRRAILDRVSRGPCTTGELAALFPTTRFAVMKHIGVLERAGLLVSTRRGRERWNHLNAVPLVRLVERWLSPLAERGARSLLALQTHLEAKD